MQKKTNPWKRVGENLVRYKPSGSIYAVFRVKGRKYPVRVSLETDDLTTARNKLPGVRHEHQEKIRPNAVSLTIATAVENYKGTLAALAESTRKYRTYVIDKFQTETPHLLVKDISSSYIEGWLAKLIQAGKASSTYNEHVAVLQGFYALLERDGAVKAPTPISHIKWRRREKKIKLIPNDEQAALLIADMRAKKDNRSFKESADFTEFMLIAGVGNGETAALKWKHVDFLNNEMHLFRLKTRMYYPRRLNTRVREFLLKRYDDSDKNGETSVFSIKNPRKAIENACKRLGLPHYSNRTMRRYFITDALRKGIQPDVIAKWQNHHDGGKLILDTYGQVTTERELEALEKLG